MNAPQAHPRLFRDRDADPGALRGKTIAILGYGLLGQPLALNLRDSLGSGPNPATVIVGSDVTISRWSLQGVLHETHTIALGGANKFSVRSAHA